MKLDRSLTLPLAAALVLGGGTALAEEATDAQLRQVDVRKIVLAHDDATAPKTGVFVKRIQTNGEDPTTLLQVLGSDAKAIELDDLADGETRTFELGDGKTMDVERDGELLRLDVDGEEIRIPLHPGGHADLPGLAGLDGAKRFEVMMLTDAELHGAGAHGAFMAFTDADGNVQHPTRGGDFAWTEDDGALTQSARKVIVKCLETDAGDDESVQVVALPAFPLAGLTHRAPDFESLESLQDADPEVRAKVIEALKEILAQHHAIQLSVTIDEDDDAVRQAGTASRASQIR